MLLLITNASGQDVPLGARPTAMGEAFVAIADDGNAAFWNPAGLSLLQGLELNSMYADLYATGIKHSFLGLALPFKGWGSWGLAWSQVGFDDYELSYGESQFLLSYALRLPRNISFGLNAKLLRTDGEYEGVSFADAHGWGLDLGLLYRPFEALSLGVVLKDVGDTGVTYDTGNSAPVLEQTLSLGAAYRLTDRLLLAGGLDDRLHWGGEYCFSEGLALRAGLQDDLGSNEPLSWSFGAGFRFKMVQFDYAYVDVPTLPSTHRFSFAVRFEQEEPWVQIERVQLYDIFAAQYKRFVGHPIGSVSVVNVSHRTVRVRAGVEFNHYTDGLLYGDQSAVLEPEESKQIPLFVIFNRNISSVTSDGSVQGKISILCISDDAGGEKKVATTQKANLFGRNAIRWDDVRKLAAFIAPKDRSVRAVTSRALKAADEEIAFLPQNLMYAIAIFDLLGEHGLVYSPDPQTPYSTASRLHEVVDHVQYPAETLTEKRGDCDDFVVLSTSCLENVGVPTAILDVPGHLLLALSIGAEEDDGLTLGFEENASFRHNGRVWIPVEPTLLGNPFYHAWQEGVNTIERWHEELHVVEVDEAWQVYPSNEIDVGALVVSIDATGRDLLAKDLEEIKALKYDNILKNYGSTLETNPVPCSTFNEIGVHLGQAGLLDEAIEFLRKACRADSSSWQAFNNLGVAYSKKGLYPDAEQAFQKALRLNPKDADVHLNLAFLYYELGDLDQARKEYEEAVKLNPEFEGRFEFLEKRSDLQKKDRKRGGRRVLFMWK
ncbi:MAG: tetratricopeptide repeat protein [bacterium]